MFAKSVRTSSDAEYAGKNSNSGKAADKKAGKNRPEAKAGFFYRDETTQQIGRNAAERGNY